MRATILLNKRSARAANENVKCHLDGENRHRRLHDCDHFSCNSDLIKVKQVIVRPVRPQSDFVRYHFGRKHIFIFHVSQENSDQTDCDAKHMAGAIGAAFETPLFMPRDLRVF